MIPQYVRLLCRHGLHSSGSFTHPSARLAQSLRNLKARKNDFCASTICEHQLERLSGQHGENKIPFFEASQTPSGLLESRGVMGVVSEISLPGTHSLPRFPSLSFFLGCDWPGWWFAALTSLNGVLGGRLALALLDLAGQSPGLPPASNCP